MKLSRANDGASAGSAGRADETIDHRAHGLRDGLDGLRDLMEALLAPNGCPWDREQTLDTLRPYLLEEAHEVLEALEDPVAHRQELGDLLFQIVFHAALREREEQFDLDDVIASIRTKMIRRHPHVFAAPGTEPATIAGAGDVARQWEQIKREERGSAGPPDPLGGVPAALPALQRAWRLQQKAAAVGFDWPDIAGAMAKLDEELDELAEARTGGEPNRLREELGDVLFVLVRIGQKLGVEAEDALRRANRKFESRFAHMMRRCHEAGIDPADAGLEQLEAWWSEAKTAPPDSSG